jgi:hypothetical protein
MKKQNDVIKLKWETNEEYDYRNNIYLFSDKLNKILGDLENLAKQSLPNYQPMLDKVRSNYGRFIKLLVPDCYKDFHNLYKSGLEYYMKGLVILVNTFIDKKENKLPDNDKNVIAKITKAGNFFQAGDAYFRIANTKNFELFEKQQIKYREEQEKQKNKVKK